jgi:hypothetical protein
MKNIVFWDVTPRDSCKNRRFGGTYRLNHQGENNRRAMNNVNSNYQPKHVLTNLLSLSLGRDERISLSKGLEAV